MVKCSVLMCFNSSHKMPPGITFHTAITYQVKRKPQKEVLLAKMFCGSCRIPHFHQIQILQPHDTSDKYLWVMYGDPGGYLRIRCEDSSVLESSAMPCADPALSVWNVNVANCQLPTAGSLADKLAELSITMLINQTDATEPHGNLVIENIPPASLLTTKLFAGLENLVSLQLYAHAEARVSGERYFLSALQRLRSIKMQYVTLPAGELDAQRPSLRELTLSHTGIKRLPEAIYSSPFLLTLKVESENALDAVAVPPKLRSLELQSPATTLHLDAVPALERLAITHWTEPQPPPLTRCDNLRKLHLTAPVVHTLPYAWLANCSSLEEIVIKNARNLTTLPERLLGSSHSDLSLVAFNEGALETLSEGQFEGASDLFTLDLYGNHLRTIPSGTLPFSLEKLDLSSNDMDGSILDVVASVGYRLKQLNLADNPRLGDVCGKNGYSPLREVSKLRSLLLSNTNVTRICKDWREDMPLLKLLDLSNTSVFTLSFDDLQFRRTVPADVLLLGAPVTLLEMTRDDFKKAKRTPTSGSSIHLDDRWKLQCDCRMYWTRRILDRSPHVLARINVLHCTGGSLLSEVLPENTVCVQPEECAAAALPVACTCTVQPDEDPDQSRQLVRVRCENAKLHRLPRLPASDERHYELLLAHNTITDLHANELHHIKGLDLRNNYIRRVDEETATRLGSIGGMLRLAGNPLECDCSAAPLLRALHSRTLGYTDLEFATCSDGAALFAAPIVDCPNRTMTWLLVGLLAALFALSVVTITYLASRERRFFAKAVLHWTGCLWCVETDEEERRYDAFVTFSRNDDEIVRALVTRLEPPYRLCLHDRDWVPGLQIQDQIVDSVRESHRTVVLVSRHFLASSWARAELREAHKAEMIDARPRLILILLEDPAALPLDDQLQRYIATHTCLRWGDPWFYQKLAVALPCPRRPDGVTHSVPYEYKRSFSELSTPTTLTLLPPTELEKKRCSPSVKMLTSADVSKMQLSLAMKLYAKPRSESPV